MTIWGVYCGGIFAGMVALLHLQSGSTHSLGFTGHGVAAWLLAVLIAKLMFSSIKPRVEIANFMVILF